MEEIYLVIGLFVIVVILMINDMAYEDNEQQPENFRVVVNNYNRRGLGGGWGGGWGGWGGGGWGWGGWGGWGGWNGYASPYPYGYNYDMDGYYPYNYRPWYSYFNPYYWY
jgi:hypothetical protein